MPRITHVKDSHFNLDYGYLFDLQTHEELMDYWQHCRSGQIRDGVKDVIRCLDSKGHITTSYGSIIDMRMRVGGEGLLQAVVNVESSQLLTMQKILREDGRLLVNTNGGYFTPHKDLEFLDTMEVKKYILPEHDTISITKWPGGEHYYAKVGNEEVELYGRRKWDTHKEAMHAALKFQQEKE